MRPTKKPTLRQQLDTLLEDISDRGREVMIMADLWREERIKSKKLVEALESIASEHRPRHADEDYWISIDHKLCADVLACDTRLAREALAEYKKEETE